MEQAKNDVFISYRRDSGTHQAKALRAVLENLGYSVFIDTRKMGSGDFTKKLDEKIRESCNFVVVISKDCFPHKKEGTDYFLYEITLALKLGKNVIPVYYDGMSYESIQKYLLGIEDFNKQNYIIYHDDADEGSDNQLVSYLKTEKEVLNDRFISLSKERATVRKELVLIEKNKVNPKCPVCGASHSITMTYCNTCGYKFFDDLEKLAVDPIEQLQEDERLEKHKEIWLNCRSDENVAKLKQLLHETEMKLRNATEECNKLGKQLEEQFHTYNNEYEELKNQMRLRLDESELEHKQQEKKLKDQLQESETKRKGLEGQCIDLEKQLGVLKKQVNTSAFGYDSLEIPINDEVSFKMIRVEGGDMGTFYIGETQVTQAVWQAVMGENPSRFIGKDYPVECVSWNDICGKDGTGTDPNCFLFKLNQKTEKNFRLPKESEWEYAAKGGNKSGNYTYAGSNHIKEVAWYDWNSHNSTHSVKQKSPNELGVYDMSGNVWEWCEDLFSGSSRVLRGGSWDDGARSCRVLNWHFSGPGYRCNFIGFRLVLPQ